MATRKWSRKVTERSNALDLEHGVFTHDDPKQIARSLKRSSEESKRRKAEPFRSAMSMLNLYINRAGKNLPSAKKARLEKAKDELRKLYGKNGPTHSKRKTAGGASATRSRKTKKR